MYHFFIFFIFNARANRISRPFSFFFSGSCTRKVFSQAFDQSNRFISIPAFLFCSYPSWVFLWYLHDENSPLYLHFLHYTDYHTGTSHYKTFNQRLTKRASPITSSILTEDNVFIISSLWPICSYLEASYSETLFSGFTHRKVCCESKGCWVIWCKRCFFVETIILRN